MLTSFQVVFMPTLSRHWQGIQMFSLNFVLSSIWEDFVIVIKCCNFHFFLLLSDHCSSTHSCPWLISHNASKPSPDMGAFTSHVGGESGGAGEWGRRKPYSAVPFECRPSVTSHGCSVLDSALLTICWWMHQFYPGCGRFGPAVGLVEQTATWQVQTGGSVCQTRYRYQVPRVQEVHHASVRFCIRTDQPITS